MAIECKICASATNVVSKFPRTVEPVAVTLSAGTQPLLSINECCANRKAASIPSSGNELQGACVLRFLRKSFFRCLVFMDSFLFLSLVLLFFSYGVLFVNGFLCGWLFLNFSAVVRSSHFRFRCAANRRAMLSPSGLVQPRPSSSLSAAMRTTFGVGE